MAKRSRRSRKSKRRSKQSRLSPRTRRSAVKRASILSRKIDSYLKTLKTGGGRLESWQDKYPMAGTSPWSPSNNICKYPSMANSIWNPPGSRGGRRRSKKGGQYIIPETYFGRKPVGYAGPAHTPHPTLKAWDPANA